MASDRPLAMLVLAGLLASAPCAAAFGAYKQAQPKPVPAGAIEVTEPGMLSKAGATYVLTKDISSDRTALFLASGITLDLNGHTVTYADAKYEHVPNYGFEEGLKGWDVSKAPGAKVIPSSVHPMVGEKILQLKAGDEIVSQYINLPVAERSYDAMCAVATNKMRITINVDDENGKPITCNFTGGSERRVTPPEVKRHPELGGGVIFAHMHHMSAGKYRIRIKAETDCQIDECDIRPSLDAGVAVVGAIQPWATYNDHLKWYPCAFFDYNKKGAKGGTPAAGIPVVKGAGTVTIRNGVIRNGTVGMRTLGVQSNAKGVTVLLENVKILNAGINCNSARIAKATLRNCRFEVDTPFIINRHNTSEMNVQVGSATEVVGCEFIGGQGSFSGTCPEIHDNLFVNGQTVTNHYSISPGSGTRIYRNRFEPKIGSGIYIGRGHDVEVFDNVFKIECAPPNCEYRYSGYSTNAIRLSDYNASSTGPVEKRCANNRVYRNKIYITGKSYPHYKGYRPRAYAFFISVGGGTNYIYDNEIYVQKVDGGNGLGLAFMIGGSSNGGEIYNNKITSNCAAAWIGTDYGYGRNMTFRGNTFVKAPGTPGGVKPFILGHGGNAAQDIRFYSNTYQGWSDIFQYHSNSISYSVGWTLTVKVRQKAGGAAAGAEVVISEQGGREVFRKRADEKGVVVARLAEYKVTGRGNRTDCSAYTVKAGAAEKSVKLTRDLEVTITR